MQADDLVGQRLGKYELQKHLGAGNMGKVYLGRHPDLERDVAIKVLPAHLAYQSKYTERFLREARIVASLSHAHIIPIYDFGVDQNRYYVVMRLLSGMSLAERIENDPLPLHQIIKITKNLCDALDYAHQKGIIHRDIKPSNIMFDEHGEVMLVDFGIAKLVESDTHLTSPDARPGTPTFMAPEQWLSNTITTAVDQYALAITVYKALTGELPFDGRTTERLSQQHLYEPPAPLEKWRTDLPKGITPVLQRALEKKPADRFPSMTAFANALALTANDRSLPIISDVQPHSPSVSESQIMTGMNRPVGKPRRFILPVILAAAVIFSVVLLLINRAEPTIEPLHVADLSTTTEMQPSVAPTFTPSLVPSETPTPEPSHTLTSTSEPTIDIALAVATLDAQNTEAAHMSISAGTITQAAGLTATAVLWTPTPSPDITASIEVYLTQRAVETVAAIVQELTAMAVLATTTPVPTQIIPSETPTATVTLAPTAAPNHTEEQIAFVSKKDGNDEIYVINIDGSQLTRLTSNENSDFYLDWSEVNSRIAFVSNRDGNNEIYSMNADGSDQKRLTDNAAHDYAPAWSPDGSQIAFTTGRTGSWEIYKMSANGTNLTRLTNNNVEDWNPSISPDGTKIVFTTNRDNNWEIYTMNIDGSDLRRLTNHSSEDNAPVWSPDGSRIAFYSDRDGNFEIYAMNADGSNPVRLTHNPADDLGPAWSPDGSRIAFYSDRDGDDEIYIMNADGSHVAQVTNNSFNDRSPIWLGQPSN